MIMEFMHAHTRMFLIFVNDIPSAVRQSSIYLYADDTKCLMNVCSSADCRLLQDDIFHLSSWSKKWNLYFNGNKCVLLRFCSKFPHVSYDYTIRHMPIKCVESYQDLGITMSSNLQWRDHINYISSRAYRMLGLIRRCFSSDLDPTTKLSLYISLVRSQLTYCSQIWRPHLLKDISSLERIQRRATKFILQDFHSDYKSRLTSLHLLPLMMQLELYDIMFFTNCLKNDRKSKTCVHSYVTLSTSSTRSATHFKLKHSL